MKYTPAPWKIIDRGKFQPPNFRIVGGGHVIAETILYNYRDRDNAKLIAAAPLLLEALQGLQNAFIHTKGNKKGNIAKSDIIKHNPEVSDALNASRQAINAATQ